MRGAAPAVSDVAQDQPQEFGSGLIAGEVTPRFHRPAQLRVDALKGVGSINHLADRRREHKERQVLDRLGSHRAFRTDQPDPWGSTVIP